MFFLCYELFITIFALLIKFSLTKNQIVIDWCHSITVPPHVFSKLVLQFKQETKKEQISKEVKKH